MTAGGDEPNDPHDPHAVANRWPPQWHQRSWPASITYQGVTRDCVADEGQLVIRPVAGQGKSLLLFGAIIMVAVTATGAAIAWVSGRIGDVPHVVWPAMLFCGGAAVAIMAAVVDAETRGGSYLIIETDAIGLPRFRLRVPLDRAIAFQVLEGPKPQRPERRTQLSLISRDENGRIVRDFILAEPTTAELAAIRDATAVPIIEAACPAGFDLRSDAASSDAAE